MYRLAYVYTGWSERRAFAPVFLAFVLRGESFLQPSQTLRFIHLGGPAIAAKPNTF